MASGQRPTTSLASRHDAVPAITARLCPQAYFLPARMDRYAQVSQQIRGIFEQYTLLVEPLSLDEAFLDVTDSTSQHERMAVEKKAPRLGRRSVIKTVGLYNLVPHKCLHVAQSDTIRMPHSNTCS